ncbi:MAG TPA: SDR family NAD(P)-dependent oxidoreductase [Stellaceae bacterium]|nr:SDR family NAD(P)-dependent oxidoreductase [Stellaceae bacterium]
MAALAADIPIREIALDTLRDGLPCRIGQEDHYARCAAHGLTYGPAFRGLAEAWMREGEVLARIETPSMLNVGGDEYLIHPAVLDACLQSVVSALPGTAAHEAQAAVFLPTQLDRFRFFGARKPISWCRARVRHADRRSIVASFALFDEAGTPIAEIDNMRFRRMRSPQASEISAWHWRAQLQPSRFAAASAADLPGPKSIASALAKEVEDLRHDAGYIRFRRDAGPALDRLAALYVRRTLERLGAGDGPFRPADLAERAAIAPDRARGLRALLNLAEGEGHLRRAGDNWTLVPGVAEDPEKLWRRLVAEQPASLASLEAVARCGDHLLELLRGEADVVQLMFPERDFSAGEQLLDADPALSIGNETVACVMRHLRDATPRDRALRILEIGGATGGLTSAVLSALPAERAAYFFTDAFESAVARAQGRFSGFPFVHYAVFDVEHDAAEQGLEAGSFDVIVAAHALGGAPMPGDSLERLRRLLKPGGLLLLVETKPSGFLDFIFGSWRRRFSPSIEPATSSASAPPRWTTLLDAAGFAEIAVLGDDGADAEAITVSILARNPEAKPSLVSTPIKSAGNWVVLGGGKAHVPKTAVATRLALAGQRVLTVVEDDVFARLDDTTLQAPLDDPDDYHRLVAALKAYAATGMDIVYARSLTRITNGAARDPMTAQDHGSLGLMLLTQALIDGGLAGPVRLWVVTGGAMSVPGRPGPLDPSQAPLWGVARTLMNERPDLNIRLIDVDPRSDDAVDLLVAELLYPTDEDEIILQGTARYVQRLRRGMLTALPTPRSSSYRLVLRADDNNDGLALEANPLPHPDGDEVVVRVRAAGLNYRDVLQRVGILPEEAFEGGFAGATLGMEFAGEVVDIGPSASGFKIGDSVYGFAPSAFSSHIKVASSAVIRMPPAMTFAEAATLPVATLTAYYALHHVARLQRGETVLIHGAAGGVGLAAIQYAQHVGALVFASAGTPGKREFLRRLGVRHVVDSRSLSFADEIRRLTDGQGVDVVLNSLAGEALHKGVSLLRAYGRFVELGKRDFWANTKLGLQPFRNNIQFSGVDVDRLLVDRPALAQQLLRDLDALVARGVLHPLPHRVFPATRAADAFRHMQQSRHIGKVVLAFPEDVEVSPSAPSGHLTLSGDATYLVTGGRNGFGLATAEWLVAKGARHLVLVGRSQDTQPAAAAVLHSLRGIGVVVHEAVADVADADQLAQLLAFIRRKMPPLKGVFHCAAVIEDAAVATMSPDRFREVLRPKVAGATNLDQLTRDMPLDFFVLYSSAVTLFGNPGQSNYVAANLYLEALAAQRRAAGLPALAVLWGAIEGVGHLARNAEVAKAMSERLGVRLLPPKRALERMEQALLGDVSQVAIAEFSWSRLMHSPRLAQSPKYALVRPAPDEPAIEGEREGGDLGEKLAALPEAQRYLYVQQLVIGHLAAVLRVPATRLDVNQSLLDLGMDSLMVVELQLAMEQQFGIAISPMELMDVATVGELARRIAEKLGVEPRNAAAEEAPPADPEDIDMLPPEMLDVVLGKLLEQDDDAARAERVS